MTRIRESKKTPVDQRPSCVACGLYLQHFNASTFNRVKHYAWGEATSHTLKLTSEHTADEQPPAFGRYGDNLVCDLTCAHRLVIQLARAVGAKDLRGLLPAVPEAKRRTITKEPPPTKKHLDDLAAEWRGIVRRAADAGEIVLPTFQEGWRGRCYRCQRRGCNLYKLMTASGAYPSARVSASRFPNFCKVCVGEVGLGPSKSKP